MSNLLIAVIAIVLVAAMALAGSYFGGVAFMSGVPQARASLLINQSQQIYAQNIQYMMNNNLTSFDDVGQDNFSIEDYTSGRLPILDIPTVSFLPGGTLSDSLDSTAIRNQTCSGSDNVALDSIYVTIIRQSCVVGGKNAVNYWMISAPSQQGCTTNTGLVDLSSASAADNPLVQMCLKINAKAKIPLGATYADSGLPFASGSIQECPGASSTGTVYYDDADQFNYCYVATGGYFGANNSIIFTYTNAP